MPDFPSIDPTALPTDRRATLTREQIMAMVVNFHRRCQRVAGRVLSGCPEYVEATRGCAAWSPSRIASPLTRSLGKTSGWISC